LYGQRGSISASEAAQGRKRKRSIKFSTASEDPENDSVFLDQNGGALSAAESGETHVASTEITAPGALRRDGEEAPVTREDVEGTTGSEDVNVEVESGGSQVEQDDESSNEAQESNMEVNY
jgi:hypothetical protein